jgi:DNA transformation protein
VPASPELIANARDLFAGIGEITVGGLFGGSALYVEGDVMFACIIGGTIYMKSDETTQADFIDAGSDPFTYPKSDGETIVASLMSLPDSASDDPDEARDWAHKSYPPAMKATEKKRLAKARKAAKKANTVLK